MICIRDKIYHMQHFKEQTFSGKFSKKTLVGTAGREEEEEEEETAEVAPRRRKRTLQHSPSREKRKGKKGPLFSTLSNFKGGRGAHSQKRRRKEGRMEEKKPPANSVCIYRGNRGFLLLLVLPPEGKMGKKFFFPS